MWETTRSDRAKNDGVMGDSGTTKVRCENDLG